MAIEDDAEMTAGYIMIIWLVEMTAGIYNIYLPLIIQVVEEGERNNDLNFFYSYGNNFSATQISVCVAKVNNYDS